MKYNPSLHKLSNGVTVILDPMDIETAVVKVHFKTGSRDETPHEHGITHFCEHMLCAGTPRFESSIARELYLENLGGTKNASTSDVGTNFYGRIVGNNLLQLLDVIADQLKNSLFDSDRIELERTAILDERRRAVNRENRLIKSAFSKRVYGNDMLGFQTLGTIENIKSFTRDQLLNWYHRRFSAKNCVICISGKIMDAKAVLAQLERDFAFLPTHDVSRNLHLSYNPVCYHYLIPNNTAVQLSIWIPRQYDASNSHAHMAHTMWLRYLGQQLIAVLRYKYGLVYGVNSGKSDLSYDNGCHCLQTETNIDNIAQVFELMSRTLYKLSTNDFLTDDWLLRANRSFQLDDADFLDTPTDRCDKLLGDYCLHGTVYDFHKRVKDMNAMTADDVRRLTKDFWKSPISILTCGPKFDANLSEIWCKNFPGGTCGRIIQHEKGVAKCR
ncbi:insulinase family protein [bacterium]|nr:insulinase family protein [bacterium]